MFKTKLLTWKEVEEGKLETWLNSLNVPGFGVRIASQISLAGDISVTEILTTVSVWKLSDIAALPVRATIDEIPQEPTINYSEEEMPNPDL